MKFLSVCSGIEAASVAWRPLEWEAVAFSEIEKFPSSVLAHHYPAIPNLGDMTKFREWDEELLAEVDLVVGGTPCQAFSVAGLRGGLEDERGNLTLIFIHMVEWIDAIRLIRGKPRVSVLWENVPGVLSDSTGAFGSLLGGLAGEDDAFTIEKWPSSGVVDGGSRRVAWAVLDAQYFGVPQRRRRVFALAEPCPPSGHTGSWPDPAEILAIGASLCRHPAPRRETGEAVTGALRSRPPGSGGINETRTNNQLIPWPAEVAATMNARYADKQGLEDQHALGGASYFVPDTMGTLTARMMNALGSRDIEEGAVLPVAFGEGAVAFKPSHYTRGKDGAPRDVTPPLSADADKGDQDTLVACDVADTLSVGANQTTGFIGDVVAHQKPPAYTFKENMSFPSWSEDESPTLQAENYHAVAYPIDTQNMTENHSSGGKGFGQEDDPSFTLTKGHSHAVASIRENQRSEVTEHEISDALLSGGGKPGSGYAAIREGMAVRRLTPTECERLQGFPDGYTDIPGASDSGRYKALGNSMAVPVMNWIGMRINNAKAALSRNDKKNS